MGKKLRSLLDRYGYYAMIFLCLGTVLFAALWTRRDDEKKTAAAPSLISSDERLSDVAFTMGAAATAAPVLSSPLENGTLARGYSDQPVYFPSLRLWRAHRATDWSAKEGERILSMFTGHVCEITKHGVTIEGGDGSRTRYEGLKTVSVSLRDSVEAGDELGLASGEVAGEGTGIVHVARYLSTGEAFDFSEE